MPDLVSMPSLTSLAAEPWDILVIGGGITGAGIMREAARLGQRVLLVEQNDFASGTSSRSAKLVHGGLRYLNRFQIRLVHNAVRERERMVHAGAGLVEQLDFLLPTYKGDRMPSWLVMFGLGVYDLFAGQFRVHRHLCSTAIKHYAPDLTGHLTGAFMYADARTDDARVVLRVLQEGCRLGGYALNYVAVTEVVRDANGKVIGARLHDREAGTMADIRARVVINATGPWADRLRGQLDMPSRVRLLRGSHLIFPGWRLPISHAIAIPHPESHRPIYLVPWEGVTLVGTTHVGHTDSLDVDPCISPDETAYLLRGVQFLFPSLKLDRTDIRSTFAGVRPIVDIHTHDPAKASRDYAIWEEAGMLTVTGGKLTTFRTIALKTLQKLRNHLPELGPINLDPPVLEELPPIPSGLPFDQTIALRLLARYGYDGLMTIATAPREERQPIPGLSTLWGELRWAARAESVRHLDDLLLRRVRLGLTVPEGGLPWIERIRTIAQPELGWNDDRWWCEVEAYRETWHKAHGVPDS
jgi:glycerol-3-phosphate dehydrogenase